MKARRTVDLLTSKNLNDVVDILRTEEHAFAANKVADFSTYVAKQPFVKSVLTSPSFPQDELGEIATKFDLSPQEINNLTRVIQALHHFYTVKNSSPSNANDEEDVEPDENNSTETEEHDNGEEEEPSQKVVNFFTDNYTYRNELSYLFKFVLSKNEFAEKMAEKLEIAYQKSMAIWFRVKEKIKEILRNLGLEGVFLALHELAKRSRIIKHVYKILGTSLLPVLIISGIVIQVVRWSNNPIQSFLKWLQEEFEFQLPVPTETD